MRSRLFFVHIPVVVLLLALAGCQVSSANRDVEGTQDVAPEDGPRWTSMDELAAMTEAGNDHLIRVRMIGRLIRLEDYEVTSVWEDGRIRAGGEGRPVLLYNSEALGGIEAGDVLDLEGVIVDEGFSHLHVWVRSLRQVRRPAP